MKSANDVLLCDFCGNSQHVARLLVRGIADATICDERIDACVEIVAERGAQKMDRMPKILNAAKEWAAKAIGKR